MGDHRLLLRLCESQELSVSTVIVHFQHSTMAWAHTSLWLSRYNQEKKGKAQSRLNRRLCQEVFVEWQELCYNGNRNPGAGRKAGGYMRHISYNPLWHTLVERNMRKEDLRMAAGLTTNMIANMGKGKNISTETLVRVREALNCGILDVIELEKDDE